MGDVCFDDFAEMLVAPIYAVTMRRLQSVKFSHHLPGEAAKDISLIVEIVDTKGVTHVLQTLEERDGMVVIGLDRMHDWLATVGTFTSPPKYRRSQR